MNQNGKQITLKDREYTIYENDTLGVPYRIVDENNNTYYLLLKDDRSDKYYMVDWKYNNKGIVTKDELDEALNPEPLRISTGGNFLFGGGNISWNLGGSGSGTP